MIRWGIIGAGNIANRFCQSLSNFDNAKLYAISNRTIFKGQEFAKKYPCHKIYDNYDELINDPQVDAIYIALPHLYHFEYVIKALKKHKSVLCEKPATVSFEEMEEIVKVAKEENTLFMEAMKTAFIPGYQALLNLIGDFNQVKKVTVRWGNDVPFNPNSYLFQPIQGGCLLDVGIYNLNYLSDFGDLNYQSIKTIKEIKDGVDYYTYARFEYLDKILETTSAINQIIASEAIIETNEATITALPMHRPTKLIIEKNGIVEEKNISYEYDDFYSQINHFHYLISNNLKESPIMSYQKSLLMSQFVERIRLSK